MVPGLKPTTGKILWPINFEFSSYAAIRRQARSGKTTFKLKTKLQN